MNKIDLLQGTLDLLVLKTLSGGPMHGYKIAARIQQLSDEVLRIEEGSLYPALYRMEQKGFIESEWGCRKTTGRRSFTSSPERVGGKWTQNRIVGCVFLRQWLGSLRRLNKEHDDGLP